MNVESEEARDRRPDRFAAPLTARSGVIGMLIALVLITQAGLVYVAVDQIGTSRSATVIQPANRSTSARPPISVDAGEGDEREVPAPAVTRVPEQVQAEPEGPPSEVGLERARERAEPQGVAPPLTGSQPPGRGAGPTVPSAGPQPERSDRPGRSEAPASTRASDTGTAASERPSAAESDTDHPGRGPEGDGPPGQGGEADDGNSDRGTGGGRGEG